MTGRFGWILRPEVVDQALDRHGLAAAHEQRDEQCTLLRWTEFQLPTVDLRLERPEYPVLRGALSEALIVH